MSLILMTKVTYLREDYFSTLACITEKEPTVLSGDLSTVRADVLSLYEQNNAEITNQDPVIVNGTPQPILDITPNVSIKNTDNTALELFLNYLTQEDPMLE